MFLQGILQGLYCKYIINACNLCLDYGTRRRMDKCLITVVVNYQCMTCYPTNGMGREIFPQESKELGNHSKGYGVMKMLMKC